MKPSDCLRKKTDVKTGRLNTKVMSAKQLMIAINKHMPSMQMKDMKNKIKEDIERIASGLGVKLSVDDQV